MSADQEEMARLRRKSDDVGSRLVTLRPSAAHLVAKLRQAKALQQDLYLVTRRNISVGFAGVFTTGKSLLISLLVGRPGLLTVANAPATGNVTRLRLHPAHGGPPAEPKATVSYLSLDKVAKLSEYILNEIVKLVTKGHLPYDIHRLVGYRPVDTDHPGRSNWAPLESFLRPIWKDSTLNRQIRQWATELFAIRDALLVGGDLLPRTMPGPAIPIAITDLAEAVLIGGSREPSAAFPESAYRPPLSATDMAAPAGLRLMLPLIHEVCLDVDVPQQLWSFDGLDVDLLDFPGLASGSLRDRFLAKEELGGTTVMVIVLDAEKPKNDDVDALYTMLEESRQVHGELDSSVLVVANRFDRVPVLSPPPATVADLAARSEDYRTLHGVVRDLTADRFALQAMTSALAAALRVGYQPPESRPQDVAAASSSLTAWQPTVGSLSTQDGSHPLRVALAGYCEDGGLHYLRELVRHHVLQHGVRIWLGEAQEIERRLDAAMAELRPLESRPAASIGERERIDRLVGGAVRARRRYRDAIDKIRLLQHIPTDSETVDEAVLAQIVAEVHRWQRWFTTHDKAIRPHNYEPGGAYDDIVPSGDDGYDPIVPGGDGADDGSAVPGTFRLMETTEDILPDYLGIVDRLTAAGVEILQSALRTWTVELLAHDDFLNLRKLLTHPNGTGGGPAGERELFASRLRTITTRENAEYRLKMIDTLVNDRLVADLVTPARDKTGTGPAGPPPYADHRALPWQPAMRAGLEQFGLTSLIDPMNLHRLRADAVGVLHREVCRRLQAALDVVCGRLRQHLDAIEDKVIPTYADLNRMTAGIGADDHDTAH